MANKKQERSSRKNNRGINAHRKAGLPAKAGKRKVYGVGSKRKTKSFLPDPRVFIMTHTVDVPSRTVFNARWSYGEPVMVPRV